MTCDNWLAIAIAVILGATLGLALTNKTTEAERDEMLDEEEWWV